MFESIQSFFTQIIVVLSATIFSFGGTPAITPNEPVNDTSNIPATEQVVEVPPGTTTKPQTNTNTGSAAKPTVVAPAVVAHSSATIDASSLSTTASHPTLTGTASGTNVVYVAITNSSNVQVSGSSALTVSNSRWSYYVPQTLSPGTYKVQVLGVDQSVTGTLVISATGGTTTLATPRISFSANPTTVSASQSATLLWSVTNAQRCVLQYGGTEETVGMNGSKSVSPSKQTAYTLWCANDPGTGKDGPSASKVVTISVSGPTCTLSSNKSSYAYGDKITLSWTSQNAVYTTFPADTSGKDHLTLPGDKFGSAGYTEVTATVTGNPTVQMKVFNDTGAGSCSTTFAITE